MSLLEKIKQKAEEQFNIIVDIRHHLHQHPELSFHEHNTSAFVATQLEQTGVAYKNKIAGTGVVAIIEGKNPSKKVIALRADMDALPIQELNDVPYKSINAGVMHACGHFFYCYFF